jgi:hypothetical protein
MFVLEEVIVEAAAILATLVAAAMLVWAVIGLVRRPGSDDGRVPRRAAIRWRRHAA